MFTSKKEIIPDVLNSKLSEVFSRKLKTTIQAGFALEGFFGSNRVAFILAGTVAVPDGSDLKQNHLQSMFMLVDVCACGGSCNIHRRAFNKV